MRTSNALGSACSILRARGIVLAFVCGCLLVSGSAGAEGTDDAVVQALETARRHASQNHTAASRNAAIRAYREAAKLGSAEAQLELARILWLLTQEPPADVESKWINEIFPEALDWYRKAARRGDANIKYELATVMDQGGGTAPFEYLDWLRQAAEMGHGRAQYDYAMRLLEGVDLPRDDVAAARWLERSAGQGDLESQYLLATLHERGRGVPKSAEVARGRYRVAAELGHPTAQAVLRTAAFLEDAPCRLDAPPETAWRPIATPIATLRVPPDASEPTIDADGRDALRVTAPGITVTLARAAGVADDAELIVVGGDPLVAEFSGDAAEGTITLRWPSPSIGGTSAKLVVAYAEPASRDIACRIAAGTRLLDPVSDVKLMRIDAAASPARALLHGERAERWVTVGDIVTRDLGRVTAIEPGHVDVLEVIALRGGRGWRERLVTLRP